MAKASESKVPEEKVLRIAEQLEKLAEGFAEDAVRVQQEQYPDRPELQIFFRYLFLLASLTKKLDKDRRICEYIAVHAAMCDLLGSFLKTYSEEVDRFIYIEQPDGATIAIDAEKLAATLTCIREWLLANLKINLAREN